MNPDLPYPPGSILAAYLRDSGHSHQELSVPQQEVEVRAWCAERGYLLPDELIFRDVAKSSKRGIVGRDAFQQMTRYFSDKPQAAGLLLWDFRRWGRDLASSLYWFLDIHNRGIKIYIVSEPIPEGPFGLIYIILKLIGADEENKSRAKDIRRGHRFIINQHGGHVGRIPVGLRGVKVSIGEHRDGEERTVNHVEVDPDIGPRITQAFDLRAQGRTLLELRQLTGLSYSSMTFSRILRNPAYLGRYQWGDTVIDDYYPPLTDQETFDRCAGVGDSRRFYLGPRRAHSQHLLSGLLVCGVCGWSMVTNSKRRRDGSPRAYYRCPVAFSATKFACKPPMRYRVDEVDARVLARVKQILTTPDILTDLHTRARERQAADLQPPPPRTDELAQVRREIANITRAVQDGMYTRALAKRQKELEDREAEIESLMRIQMPGRARSIVPEALNAIQAAQFGAEFWSAVEKADPRKRQLVLRTLLERVTIVRENGLLMGELTLREIPGLGDLSGLTLPL